MNESRHYIAFCGYDKKIDGFIIVFPDIPKCRGFVKLEKDVFFAAHNFLANYASTMNSCPEPRSLEQIEKEWSDYKEWAKDFPDFEAMWIWVLPLDGNAAVLQPR